MSKINRIPAAAVPAGRAASTNARPSSPAPVNRREKPPASVGQPNIKSRVATPPVYKPTGSRSLLAKLPAPGRNRGSAPPVYRPTTQSRALRASRSTTASIQRLALPQAATVIAEDNDTLKEQYFLAKAQGRTQDQDVIAALQERKAREWREENDRGISDAVKAALPDLPLKVGLVRMAALNKAPFHGATAGMRYIRWKSTEYPHTSINFKVIDKGDTAQITGMHASYGASDTHFYWNHQSPPGTFHLSNSAGAKWEKSDVDSFTDTGRRSLKSAWEKHISKDARKVNCTAEKPPGID